MGVRFGPDGKIRGDCARGSSKEGKPKCLPRSKANALGKKGRLISLITTRFGRGIRIVVIFKIHATRWEVSGK